MRSKEGIANRRGTLHANIQKLQAMAAVNEETLRRHNARILERCCTASGNAGTLQLAIARRVFNT